jgi:hypothetical protein
VYRRALGRHVRQQPRVETSVCVKLRMYLSVHTVSVMRKMKWRVELAQPHSLNVQRACSRLWGFSEAIL